MRKLYEGKTKEIVLCIFPTVIINKVFFCFFFKEIHVHLFIYDYVESSFLCEGFL